MQAYKGPPHGGKVLFLLLSMGKLDARIHFNWIPSPAGGTETAQTPRRRPGTGAGGQMDARTVKGHRTAHRGAGVVQPVKKGGVLLLQNSA